MKINIHFVSNITTKFVCGTRRKHFCPKENSHKEFPPQKTLPRRMFVVRQFCRIFFKYANYLVIKYHAIKQSGIFGLGLGFRLGRVSNGKNVYGIVLDPTKIYATKINIQNIFLVFFSSSLSLCINY